MQSQRKSDRLTPNKAVAEKTYKGDVFYESLRAHIADSGLLQKFARVAEDEGFAPYEGSDSHFMRELLHFDRLFHAVVSAKIEYLHDFDDLFKDERACSAFLSDLVSRCKDRGLTLVAVPEDVLTFLVFKRKGDYLTKDYVRTVAGFKPQINEALIDLLEL